MKRETGDKRPETRRQVRGTNKTTDAIYQLTEESVTDAED